MYKELYGNIDHSIRSEYPKEGMAGSNEQKSSVGNTLNPQMGNTTIHSAFGQKEVKIMDQQHFEQTGMERITTKLLADQKTRDINKTFLKKE